MKIRYCRGDSEQAPMIETGYLSKEYRQARNLKSLYGQDSWLQAGFGQTVYDEMKFLKIQDKAMENFEQGYGRKNKLWQVEVLVDDVLFSKRLKYNYFTNPEDLSFHDNVLKQELDEVQGTVF